MTTCPMCSNRLRGRQETCSDRCRQRLSRQRAAERETRRSERLRALFAAQTAAALSGDTAALAAAEREAARLLGAAAR